MPSSQEQYIDSLPNTQPQRKRKRVTVSRACYHCRKAHARCSNERPCKRCIRTGRKCYEYDPHDDEDQMPQVQNQQQQRVLPQMPVFTQFIPLQQGHLNGVQRVPPTKNIHPSTIPKLYPNEWQSSSSHKMPPNQNSVHAASAQMSHGQDSTQNGPPSASESMIRSLSQTVKKQSEMIAKLLGEQKKSKQHHMSENPFIKSFSSDVEGAAMWRTCMNAHHAQLLFANKTFCGILDCKLEDLQGKMIRPEDIPKLVFGRFGNEGDYNITDFERKLLKIMKACEEKNGILEAALCDSIYYMKEKSVLNMKVYEMEMYRKDGITYARIVPSDVLDDEMTINDKHFPATITVNDITSPPFDYFRNSLIRKASAVEVDKNGPVSQALHEILEQLKENDKQPVLMPEANTETPNFDFLSSELQMANDWIENDSDWLNFINE